VADDIVTRLRAASEKCWEAADEIDRLQEENKRLHTYINALLTDRQIAAMEAHNDPF
jgi:hypothetical protein